MPDENPDFDFDLDDEEEYCDRCSNTGYVACHCGGDMCFCENQGDKPCPKCDRGLY